MSTVSFRVLQLYIPLFIGLTICTIEESFLVVDPFQYQDEITVDGFGVGSINPSCCGVGVGEVVGSGEFVGVGVIVGAVTSSFMSDLLIDKQ
jgi:hypothetical protein